MRWQAGQYVIEWTHQTSYYAYRFGKEPLGSRPDFDSAAQALVKYHETRIGATPHPRDTTEGGE
jgi:hypothetical protein